MKKVCLALLVLAISMPAIAGVTITAVKGPEANSVIISYTATEEVRAFALEVTCTDSALLPGTALREGKVRPAVDDANYYFTPSTSTVGSSSVWPYGSPITVADGNSCIIEMASLYASNDPCKAHKFAPPLSGTLLKIFVDATKAGGDGAITVAVTQANAKRGKVVTKAGASVDPVVTGASVTLVFDCLRVGEVCGGVMITSTMQANWVTAGKPASWCHPGHYAGDANLDCKVTAVDLVGPALPNFKASFGKVYPDPAYAASADTNNDLKVTAIDLVGGDPLCVGCGAKANFGKIIHGGVCP
jgi:hypothetical protein